MSERDYESMSNRSLLANAVISDMQTEDEKLLLEEYHAILKAIEDDQKIVQEINYVLRQTYSSENSDAISQDINNNLRQSTQQIAERIDKNDRQLITLETTALKNVLEREKQKAFERERQKGKEALAKYREQELKKQEQLRQQYQQRRENQKKEHQRSKEDRQMNYHIGRAFLLSLSLTIPHIMLDTPPWLICVITFLVFSPLLFRSLTYATIMYCAYDIVRPIFYAWAFIVTVQGKQDIFAIAFYILMALQSISMIKKLIGTIGIIVLALNGDKE